MMNFRKATAVGIFGLGVWLTSVQPAFTMQDPNTSGVPGAQAAEPQQEGVEVLARGPIHEAFADPVNQKPEPGPIVPKKPPEPIEELPPDQKPAGENVSWYPGYWSWDDVRNDFIWVSGVYRTAPPEKQWIPGRWTEVAGGWQHSAGFWSAVQQNVLEFLPPPPEPVRVAAPPPAPNDNSVYVPGVWVYRDTRYLWRPSFYVDYRPGWVWIPAHYVWTPVGYVFVEGYWDLDLSRRGLLFAPVYFTQPVYTGVSWYYRPSYIVYDDFLRGALFVRPGFQCYFFGDYFEVGFRNRGFTAWIDFRPGGYGYDPLFSYYRWSNRSDPRWYGDMRTLYTGRFNGDIARPPVTLLQQRTVVNNITINKGNNVTNVNYVNGLASLNNVNTKLVTLQPVTRDQRVIEQKNILALRDVGNQRARAESQLLAASGVAGKPITTPQIVKMDLSKTTNRMAIVTKNPPPPPPIAPRIIGKPARTLDISTTIGQGDKTGKSPMPVETIKIPSTINKLEVKTPSKTDIPLKIEPKITPKLELKPVPKLDLKQKTVEVPQQLDKPVTAPPVIQKAQTLEIKTPPPSRTESIKSTTPAGKTENKSGSSSGKTDKKDKN